MLSFLLSSFFTVIHPFFVSVIDMKHNVKDKTIEISAKVFVDDLEAVLKKNYNTTFDLSTSTSKPWLKRLDQDGQLQQEPRQTKKVFAKYGRNLNGKTSALRGLASRDGMARALARSRRQALDRASAPDGQNLVANPKKT